MVITASTRLPDSQLTPLAALSGCDHDVHSLIRDIGRFEDAEGQKIRLVDYFAQKYNKVLQYPNLPALKVKRCRRLLGTASTNQVGSKDTFLPMELCRIAPRQRYIKQLDDRIKAEMIKVGWLGLAWLG